MRSLQAALVAVVSAGALFALTPSAAQAADICVCDGVVFAADGQLASFTAGDDAEMGRTSCEIERGEGGDDWVIRIKHKRGEKGPKTSRCVVVPERAKDEPAPKPAEPAKPAPPEPDAV